LDALAEEKWVADFTKQKRLDFPKKIKKPTPPYIKKGPSFIHKKPSCMVWVDDPMYRYSDVIIEGELQFHDTKDYYAAGFQFRKTDDFSYYSF